MSQDSFIYCNDGSTEMSRHSCHLNRSPTCSFSHNITIERIQDTLVCQLKRIVQKNQRLRLGNFHGVSLRILSPKLKDMSPVSLAAFTFFAASFVNFLYLLTKLSPILLISPISECLNSINVKRMFSLADPCFPHFYFCLFLLPIYCTAIILYSAFQLCRKHLTIRRMIYSILALHMIKFLAFQWIYLTSPSPSHGSHTV